MTNNKKTYITPKALFINLEEEVALMAVSVLDDPTPEGQKERVSFGLSMTEYNDLGTGNSEIWGNNFD